MPPRNETHDPAVRSWVASANEGSDFPVQNLPFGVFDDGSGRPRGGIAIGDRIVDLTAALDHGLFSGEAELAARAASGRVINPLFDLPASAASALRRRVFALLREGGEGEGKPILVAQDAVTLLLPLDVRAFTDFACSYDHTYRVVGGKMPDHFEYLPLAYNGRASTVVTDRDFRRPFGQWRDADGTIRSGPEPRMDFELEMGGIVGRGNMFGEPLPIDAAGDAYFGYVLLNDWSARGIQLLEMNPLGPFLGKGIATSISPWIVTAEALLPFRVGARLHQPDAPQAPAHMVGAADQAGGNFRIELQARVSSATMRADGVPAAVITRTNADVFYWTFAQLLTHHASNGCNMQAGDLIGSGTISGPTDDAQACLAELAAFGTKVWTLPNGEERTFLLDGDEVTLVGRAVAPGAVSIGFGECRGRILPAR